MSQSHSSDDPVGELIGMHPDVQPSKYLLEELVCTIGRSQTCQIVVRDSLISRLHAKIERHGSRYILQDAGSANGTFVNGQRIIDSYLLINNDQIGLGSPAPLLRFLDPDPTLMSANRLRFDEPTMRFFLGNHVLDLAPAQFRLLRYLYQHIGEVCSRENCAQAIWAYNYDPGVDAGALDQAFSRLRRQIRLVDPSADIIKNHRGIGFEFKL